MLVCMLDADKSKNMHADMMYTIASNLLLPLWSNPFICTKVSQLRLNTKLGLNV